MPRLIPIPRTRNDDFQRPQTIVETVTQYLADGIIEGRFAAGQWLTEQQLSSELGVSRSPIREAFRILEAEGLVAIAPRRGARVAEISPRDLEDIYACRVVLEGLAARQAAERITDDGINALREVLAEMERAVSRGSLTHYFRLNARFNDLVVEHSQNAKLAKLIRSLGRQTLRIRYLSLSVPGRLQQSLEGRRAIFQAIASRSPDDAERHAQELIRQAGAAARRYLDQGELASVKRPTRAPRS